MYICRPGGRSGKFMATVTARILLIEDDDQLRGLLIKVLSRSGYAVREACNGREGSEILEREKFDAIVTDIVMPEQEGLETISQLRAQGLKIKVIAMTGGGRFSPDNYLALARQLGADATLAKPFSGKQLIEMLESVIGKAPGTTA